MRPQPCATTRISEGAARSRADGVTMVLGPMAIFRFSRMAARTSASQTKSAGCNASGGGSALKGAGIAELDEPAPEVVSQLNPVYDLRCKVRNRTAVRGGGGARNSARGQITFDGGGHRTPVDGAGGVGGHLLEWSFKRYARIPYRIGQSFHID